MDDKNKKELGYQADIQYEEDYSSDYSVNSQQTTIPESELPGISYNEDFMNNIQDHINSLVQMIPSLPILVQTAVNQVFKPILLDWHKIKNEKYPNRIPDPDDGTIITPKPKPWYPPIKHDPPDPWKPDPPRWEEPEPWVPDPWEPDPPIIVPDIDPDPIPDPTIPDPTPVDPGIVPIISDDDLFEPGSPRKVIYEDIEELEKIQLEYIKNFADVIDYYTAKLNDIISGYFLFLFSAFTAMTTEEDSTFLTQAISSSAASSIQNEYRHVMDTALRNEVVASNKLNFMINAFPLESTLYHLKSFKAIQELRERYVSIDKQENDSHASSMSNKLLNGMTNMYNAKYDVAYNNLYKYLNSSLSVLDDAMSTLMSSLKAKETIIRKDGFTK